MPDIKIASLLYIIWIFLGVVSFTTISIDFGVIDTSKSLKKESPHPPFKQCERKSDCNNGECIPDPEYPEYPNATICKCNDKYITVEEICDYEQRIRWVALLLSILVGALGVDWFYLAYGNGCYICLGILKLFTLGGLGVWWLVDWIRIVAGGFPDGNGQEMFGW